MPLHRTLLPRLPGQPLARTLAETLTRVLVLGAALAGSAAALAQPSGKQNNAQYAAMVESVDDSLGRIVETLDEA